MPPLSELTEATPETPIDDLREYAEQVVKEVAEERKGESKSDAQITNEQAAIPQPSAKTKEPPAENKSGSDTAHEGEETGDVAEGPEWLTDDVKAEVAAYGIDESEMADFASREEFDRALRFLDKKALEAGRKAMAESDDTPVRNEKGQFAKKEEPEVVQPKEEASQDGRYEVSLSPEVYDEEIIGEFTRMRDHYESRLGALESHFAEAMFKEEEGRFDRAIDKLDMPKLFGETGKESEAELKRRQDVMAQARVLQAGYRSFGREVDIADIAVRAAPMVFASEFDNYKLKKQTSKISKQSQRRQGGSPTKPLPPRDDPRDEADRLYKELSQS